MNTILIAWAILGFAAGIGLSPKVRSLSCLFIGLTIIAAVAISAALTLIFGRFHVGPIGIVMGIYVGFFLNKHLWREEDQAP